MNDLVHKTEAVTLYGKLDSARAAFHERELKKSGHNDYSDYDYFELEDILKPAMEDIRNAGLLTLPINFGPEVVTMTLVDLETGFQLPFECPMSSAKLTACHEVQNVGAVMKYLRRYLWMNLMEVVENDGLDNTEAEEPAELATAEQMASLQDYREAGAVSDALGRWLDNRGDGLTKEQAGEILGRLASEEG